MPIDPDIAERVVRFFARLLTHVKGREFAGRPFVLESWQREYLVKLLATVRPDGLRQYRRSLLAVPRKNGKSSLSAGIALYHLVADGEPGGEIYGCAADREQAGIVFRIAKSMVENSPALSAVCQTYKNEIICRTTDSRYKAISSEAFTKHGFDSSVCIFDELHAQKGRDFWDVMTTSVGSRLQPLILAITTAGSDRSTVCWDEWSKAVLVKSGAAGWEDDEYLSEIWAAPAEADWTDEAVWSACNPNLGISPKFDYMRAKCRDARRNKLDQNVFRRLHLNQWTETETAWLNMEKWDRCAAVFDFDSVAGRECWLGLDLASVRDLTALVMLFRDDSGEFAVLPRFWIPQEGSRYRNQANQIPYPNWEADGYIEIVPGATNEFDRVEAAIHEINRVCPVRQLACDPFNATDLMQRLSRDGIDTVSFAQTYTNLNEPTKLLERLVEAGKIRHNAHPVLRWNVANTSVREWQGSIRPVKPESSSAQKVDGTVALVMALAIANKPAEFVIPADGAIRWV